MCPEFAVNVIHDRAENISDIYYRDCILVAHDIKEPRFVHVSLAKTKNLFQIFVAGHN